MSEIELKNFENEFLNVLEEPESTLVLGESTSECEDFCSEGDVCKINCPKNECSKVCDEHSPCYTNCGSDAGCGEKDVCSVNCGKNDCKFGDCTEHSSCITNVCEVDGICTEDGCVKEDCPKDCGIDSPGCIADCVSDGGCSPEDCDAHGCTSDCQGDCPTHNPCPSYCGSHCGTHCSDYHTTYYYWAVGRFLKKGFYMSGSYYDITGAGGWFTSDAVSAANSTYTNILNAIKNGSLNSMVNSNTYGYMSTTGTTTDTIIGTTGSTPAVIGYIKMRLSAATHTTSSTVSIPVVARSYTSQSSMASGYAAAKTGSSGGQTQIPLQEKTFTITVAYGGKNAISGAEIIIDNGGTVFPQYPYCSNYSYALRTGRNGGVCMCTSSITTNTITGAVRRKGFNGYNGQAFTATAFSQLDITLGAPQTTDYETITLSGARDKINPGQVVPSGYENVNLTKTISYNVLNTQPIPAPSNTDVVLRFPDVFSFEPSTEDYVDDPVLGKP